MTGHDPALSGTGSGVYAIHIGGAVGPILLTSLVAAGPASSPPPDVCLLHGCVMLVSVTDDDLVDVVRRLADDGVEIGSVRDLGADAG